MIKVKYLNLIVEESIGIGVEFELVLTVGVVVVEIDFEEEEPEVGTLLVEHRHEALEKTRVLGGHTFEQSNHFTLFLQQVSG